MNEKKKIERESTRNKLKNKNDKTLNELLNEYDIDKTLGKGNFGKVKLGIHKKAKEKVSKKIFKYKNLRLQ